MLSRKQPAIETEPDQVGAQFLTAAVMSRLPALAPFPLPAPTLIEAVRRTRRGVVTILGQGDLPDSHSTDGEAERGV